MKELRSTPAVGDSMGREQLIREAETAEQLAKMISFDPDKARLLGQAARLRDQAAASERDERPASEDRSWRVTAPPSGAHKPQRLDQ